MVANAAAARSADAPAVRDGSRWIVVGAIYGALAVGAGAFGAHALDGLLDERARGWYDTASFWHAVHALALVACGAFGVARSGAGDPARRRPGRALDLCGGCFAAGTFVFSGSLYLMSATGATWLGAITPIGGVLLIAGWVALAIAAWRSPT